MKTIRTADPSFRSDLQPLLNRTAFDPVVEASVARILARVREGGDQAVAELALKFDRVVIRPDTFRVAGEEIERARNAVAPPVREAIGVALRQVQDFARQRIPKAWSYSPRPGVTAGEQFAPLDRVGCYVPGGTAPLVSTVIHTVGLASVAGVKEIVVITPPGPGGAVSPAILHAARCAGATEICRLGGVYGIGALAFGTETLRRVEKIVGPGNAYVTVAKRQVYGYVALDLVAGPSEIMIIADETADPRHVAADMLSQAEHGSGREQAVLVTPFPALGVETEKQLRTQSARLGRQECVQAVLDKGCFTILVRDLTEAAHIANRYAPEHLEIMTRRPAALAKRITAAGAIFLGPWTPEPAGDFVAGPSHVLPTGGAGRYFSGLTVEQFFRRMSVLRYRKQAFLREQPFIDRLAAVEGLDAYARSASIRLDP